MADVPVPSLARARELKITELSTLFANDDLTLEELERRIELVYKAGSMTELDAVTADLRSLPAPASSGVPVRGRRSAAPAPTVYEQASARVLSLMSSTRRVGRWAVPQELKVVALMSDTRIDLTQAVLPPGIVDVELRCVMTAFKLVVPPNVRVVNEAHAVMASITSRADEVTPGTTSGTIIRLSGFALMSEEKVVVRRVEDALLGDGEDDDHDDDDD